MNKPGWAVLARTPGNPLLFAISALGSFMTSVSHDLCFTSPPKDGFFPPYCYLVPKLVLKMVQCGPSYTCCSNLDVYLAKGDFHFLTVKCYSSPNALLLPNRCMRHKRPNSSSLILLWRTYQPPRCLPLSLVLDSYSPTPTQS